MPRASVVQIAFNCASLAHRSEHVRACVCVCVHMQSKMVDYQITVVTSDVRGAATDGEVRVECVEETSVLLA